MTNTNESTKKASPNKKKLNWIVSGLKPIKENRKKSWGLVIVDCFDPFCEKTWDRKKFGRCNKVEINQRLIDDQSKKMCFSSQKWNCCKKFERTLHWSEFEVFKKTEWVEFDGDGVSKRKLKFMSLRLHLLWDECPNEFDYKLVLLGLFFGWGGKEGARSETFDNR